MSVYVLFLYMTEDVPSWFSSVVSSYGSLIHRVLSVIVSIQGEEGSGLLSTVYHCAS